jgi:1-acyl-sn-glycerol-3-phosphate acyltransferase
MLFEPSLPMSRSLLTAMGTRMFVYGQTNIPEPTSAVIVVSNHRSFMDAALLIQALQRPIRIACHHYMGQTPILREFISLLGCFPLGEPQNRQQDFFEQATHLLRSQQWVGLFPEGTLPMVKLTKPQEMTEFHRGFAHLALKVPIPNLAVLPVAIASVEETITSTFPVKWLRFFDPSEPLFDRPGYHPAAIYHRVNVIVGRPYWIGERQRQQYHGKGAKKATSELSDYCRQEIYQLLQKGYC